MTTTVLCKQELTYHTLHDDNNSALQTGADLSHIA